MSRIGKDSDKQSAARKVDITLIVGDVVTGMKYKILGGNLVRIACVHVVRLLTGKGTDLGHRGKLTHPSFLLSSVMSSWH